MAPSMAGSMLELHKVNGFLLQYGNTARFYPLELIRSHPPPQKKSHALALWQKKNNFSAPSAMLCCVTGNGVAWNETLQL